MTPLRILFSSAGRRVELTRCFRSAAITLGIDLDVHACDMESDLSAACRDADARFSVPRCTAPDYVDTLLDYCESNAIDLLVPTIDTELAPLSDAHNRFKAIGTNVHISGPDTIAVVRDKALTMNRLGAAGVPVPATVAPEVVLAGRQAWHWPSFIKPSAGSASRGIGIVASSEELRADYEEPMILQELLEGDEYTVNIYICQQGRLRSVVPHKRLTVRAGEVEKGQTVRRGDIAEIARAVVSALPDARGVLCFQLIDDLRKGPCVFEINARFGGGYPLVDRAGGRFAESLLSLASGGQECASDDWREGTTMLRYDAAVFL